MKNNRNIDPKQRIIYVEPNDVYDYGSDNKQQNESLTPKYEDFCVSFNLIIETFSRFKPGHETSVKNNNESKTYQIEFGLNREEMYKNRTSVLQGNRGPDELNTKDGLLTHSDSGYNYLTTYYTDISFDSYKERTEIEGLGVESVQISYESWYTPTVVIKFVDVRGSALWGREEAIHIDEQLTAENVFGAFFTMPYPLFRLQVKGFLGKPVTYQLACSNFKGEFNSQTGNFEAVATFIGYSWSLLTDIPFAYLVAAPYATYLGYEYWEEKKESEEWGLWNDDGILPPPKLYDLFENIVAALDKDPSYVTTEEQQKQLNDITTSTALLQGINNGLKEFKNKVKKICKGSIEVDNNDEKNKQLVLFNETETISLTDEIKNTYKKLYDNVSNYQNAFNDSSEITIEKLPNKWKELPDTIILKEIFQRDYNGSYTRRENQDINSIPFNDVEDNDKLTLQTAQKLQENIKGCYCYLINLYDLESLINTKNEANNEKEKKIAEEVNKTRQLSIIKILSNERDGSGGFKPFIGNVFKIIFCHLETFCHIMFKSADEIYKEMESGGRTPTSLGLNIVKNADFDTVDIINGTTEKITPWPALYDRGHKGSECGYRGDIANIYGWPGDVNYGHKFIEEKVVYALQEGVQRIVEQKKMDDMVAAKKLVGFPITPSDYSVNYDIFGDTQINNQGDLAGYLAMRIVSIFGVLCNSSINDEISKGLGKIDAYNFSIRYSSINSFQNIIQQIKTDTLFQIMCCKETTEANAYADDTTNNESGKVKKYTFEKSRQISKNKNNRHPFFNDSGNSDNVDYIHFYDKNNIDYIPSRLKGFNKYQSSMTSNEETLGNGGNDIIYDVRNNNDLCFIPNYRKRNDRYESMDWLHICNSASIEALKNHHEVYTNQYMFDITTEENLIKGIRTKYQELTQKGNKIGDYEITDDISRYLDGFVKVGAKNTSKYFKGVNSMLSANIEKLQLDKEKLLPETTNIDFPSGVNYKDWVYKDGAGNFVTINDEGVLNFNDGDKEENVSISELVIQQFKIYYKPSDENIENSVCSIFGCPFYYIQDNIKAKALLFLHTFKYNYNGTNLNVFSPHKTNGATEEVPKAYLLLLGGLLWRKKQTKDPILYEKGVLKFNTCNQNNTLFYNKNGTKYFFVGTTKSHIIYNYSINDLLGGLRTIDYNIENQLISLFEKFAQTTFNYIANKYEVNYFGNITNIGDLVDVIKNDDSKLSNSSEIKQILGKYSSIYIDTNKEKYNIGVNLLFNEKNTDDQALFKDLYTGSYIITDSCYKRLTKDTNSDGDIKIKRSVINSYLEGFINECNNILNKETTYVAGEVNLNVSKETLEKRDLSIAIYYYLKNLWDKWLVCSKEDAFTVKNFFDKNFIFTDSFYKNTYHELAINCESIVNAWKELADNGSLFHFLSRIVNDHGCIFLPVPDYVGFNGKTQKEDVETMENLFRPLPYNTIEGPSNSNKFIVMYTHSPSHVKDNSNAYPTDSYDIWSQEGGLTPVARELFKSKVDRDEDSKQTLVTREGYNVPSFGVSFGKQNNHIFKNLRLTMDNPVMTEQAIKAQWQIALKGSSEMNAIAFLGQDTFNVFTNYSYTIDIEMMGNAQICPLMYFQLTNVPMWRGTYMIFKVVHNLTAGNMTTTITAMKMNKYAQPFNTEFLTNVPGSELRQRNKRFSEDCPTEDNNNTYNSGFYISEGDVVGLVGDSYAVGMSNSGFVKIAREHGITAKVSPFPHRKGAKDMGDVAQSDTVHFSRGGAHCTDVYGIRNAVNAGCTVIVVHLGINDIGNSKTCDNLKKVVNVASGRAKVFLCVPTQPQTQEFLSNNGQAYKNMVKGIIAAAEQTGCGLINYSSLQNKLNPYFKKDKERLHPVGGYPIISEEIIKQLISNGVNNSASGYTGDVKVNHANLQKILAAAAKNEAKLINGRRYKLRKKILGGSYYIDRTDERVKAQCTSGPTTWYAEGGVNLGRQWWKYAKDGIRGSNMSDSIKFFKDYNMDLVWHCSSRDIDGNFPINFKLLPGDICTLYAYNGNKNTAHGAMWTGSEWKSDFIQERLWVYGKNADRGKEGETVCIWRCKAFWT